MSKNYSPLEYLKTEQSVEKLENLLRNALDKGGSDIAHACVDRIIEVKALAESPKNDFERGFYMALQAYERVLSEKNGRTTYAHYTRRKLDRDGVQKTLADLVRKGDKSYGLGILRERDALKYAFEHVVIKHPDHFDRETVILARRNLDDSE